MKYNWFEHSSAPSKMLLVVALMAICLIIGLFVSVLVAVPLTGLSINEVIKLSGTIGSNANINILKLFQSVQSIALFVLPPLLLAPLFGQTSGNYLKLNVKPKISLLISACLILIVAIPFVNYIDAFNAKLSLPSSMRGLESWLKNSEKNAADITELFLNVKTVPALLFNVFMFAVLPALGEELMFRGVFQRLFTEWFKNPHIAIITTAAFFSAIHLQFYGFLPRMILGMVLGYLFYWSGSIWLSVAAHFINNALTVVAYYFISHGSISKSIENVGATNDQWVWATVSLFLMSGMLASVRRRSGFHDGAPS